MGKKEGSKSMVEKMQSLNNLYQKQGQTQTLINSFAKETVNDLNAVEFVPNDIRYENDAFKESIKSFLDKKDNGKDVLKSIRASAYRGQEKEAFGKSRNKEEALSGELWFGTENSVGLHQLSEKALNREKIIEKILKPADVSTELAGKAINLKGNLESTLSEAFKRSEQSKPKEGNKKKNTVVDINEEYSRKRG